MRNESGDFLTFVCFILKGFQVSGMPKIVDSSSNVSVKWFQRCGYKFGLTI